MADGMSSYLATQWLKTLCNATSFVVSPTVYVQLHIGAPGAAGTSNPATEASRKAITFATAAAGSVSNSAAISWAGISGSQDATDFSLWDASTGGNFLGSGVITANAYTAGDTYTAAIGAFSLSLPIAS